MDRPTFNPGAFGSGKVAVEEKPFVRDTTAFNPAAISARFEAKAQQIIDLRTAPLGPVRAWSMSRLFDFENCPHAVYLSKVENMPSPSGPAAERGTAVHDHIEKYIQGEHADVIKEMSGFRPLIDLLRDEFAAARVEVEGDWAFDRTWNTTGWSAKDAWARFKLDAIHFQSDTSAKVIDWKGLALDTRLPTPTGWTTMADVQVGDQLFGSDGKPCAVVGKSEVHHRACYRITFDDTSTVECDDEHLWETVTRGVISTAEIAELRAKGEHVYMSVATASDLPVTELPIDPYILGLWLGDGKHTSGEICKPDAAIWDYVAERGFETGGDYNQDNDKSTVRTVYGLRKALRKAGILGNKHIPAIYLRASYQQRLDLLRGLMDSDGNANPHRKQCVFTTCDRAMSDAVMELLFSLGQRPNQAITTQRGFGKTVTAYPVHFRPLNGLQPFALPRKADRVGDWGNGRSDTRRVTTVEPIATVPTQCIAVNSPDNTYLCTDRWLVTHNTGRKFGNELKHNQQGMGYAIAAFARYPELEFVEVQFAYLDKFDELRGSYTRQQAELLRPMLEERADKMTTCTDFEPKPSFHACRWCPHAKVQEGRDEPACKWANEQTTH
jgi:hypothetical protein